MLNLGLQGKRALVAGAGHRPPRPGIGRAAALALAEAGAKVACIDLDAGRAQAVADEVNARGGEAVVIAADLRDRQQVEETVDQATKALGGLDLCVDIIGEARWAEALAFSETDWDWTFETNLKQVFLLFQCVARRMVEQGNGGALVAVSSVDGLLSSPFHIAYGSAKAGLISLVKTLSEELGGFGIRVNAVAPGAVWSPSGEAPVRPPSDATTPLRRPTAEDIARALVFFASDLAESVTGQTLAVDGGASVKNAWGMSRESVAARLR